MFLPFLIGYTSHDININPQKISPVVGIASILIFIITARSFTFSDSFYQMSTETLSLSYWHSATMRLFAATSGCIAFYFVSSILFNLFSKIYKPIVNTVVYLGTITLPIYLIHLVPYPIYRHFKESPNFVITHIILPVSLILFSVVTYRLLSRNPTLRKILLGERIKK